MGLEVAVTINQLVTTNPDGTDNISQGDDHIRLIKSTLKNTFPAVTEPVTVSAAQLNAVGADGAINFPGMIVMWSGSVTSLPAGWKLCDGTGTISTGGAVPNLTSKFIIASNTNAGGTYNVGSTGGSASTAFSGITGGTGLSVAQMPAHTHAFTAYSAQGGDQLALPGLASDGSVSAGVTTTSVGSGAPHTHTINGTVATIPPYFALAFLIKN